MQTEANPFVAGGMGPLNPELVASARMLPEIFGLSP